ncbi:GIY-YIG nuclease family protein [Burkholderia sola]|uniref:GIY-YIG nuclease family protein n=1 Tax=Burkholderia TaxID=32008 RepID=UPI001AE49BFC|nr:GIY-YIG nuclease family protein [Burkholderia sp. AcTa6-5]MBP0714871.1 GIY-YIG nuclease family protein [Burkholderia sp. AcTa6-5]
MKERPNFIPRDIFRQYLKPAHLNRYAVIDGILPSSFINREAKLGRPIKSMGEFPSYRMIDVVARAYALCLSVGPVEEVLIARSIDTPRAEEASLRVSVEESKHALAINSASLALTGSTLLTEAEIVAGSVTYQPRCGVYFLIKGERVCYVGQSINIEARVRTHYDRFKFEAIAYIQCEQSSLDKMESLYIHTLRPECNGRLNTNHGDTPSAPLSLSQLLGK